MEERGLVYIYVYLCKLMYISMCHIYDFLIKKSNIHSSPRQCNSLQDRSYVETQNIATQSQKERDRINYFLRP